MSEIIFTVTHENSHYMYKKLLYRAIIYTRDVEAAIPSSVSDFTSASITFAFTKEKRKNEKTPIDLGRMKFVAKVIIWPCRFGND